MCRIAGHEQSAAHNEDDDRGDAATRGHQGSPSGSVVRHMIATINVTSATSGGGATKAHIPDTGGSNITGRMAELDYLFSEADLDIIGVQESRPQTQIHQTRDYTVFNSGASPGKHHYGVQLWIKKRHAIAVKSTVSIRDCLSQKLPREPHHMTESLEYYTSLFSTHRVKWCGHTTLTLSTCKCTRT